MCHQMELWSCGGLLECMRSEVTPCTFILFSGKADSLKGLQDEIVLKSKQLEGLDAKLKDILGKLRNKAQDLSTCQG